IVRVRRGRVDVVVALLYVLAVVSFGPSETEESLLQNGVDAVPECGSEAESTFAVAEAEQAILAPAVGSAASVVVREVGPAFTVGGVILADGPPLTLGQVRSPALPVPLAPAVLGESHLFRVRHGRRRSRHGFSRAASSLGSRRFYVGN